MPSGAIQPGKATAPAGKKKRNQRLVLAFFVFLGLVVFLESPLTRVRHTSVEGNQSIPVSKVIQDSQVRTGMSLWQVNPEAINNSITSLDPLVQSVKVSTDYLHGVVMLSLKQKSVVAIYENGGHFYRLLDDGTVYDETTANQGLSWPIVTADTVSRLQLGKQTTNPFVQVLCQELEKVGPTFSTNISEFHIDNFGVITMYMNDGFVAKCRVQDVTTILPSVYSVIQYFSGKGYAPGTVDMTGQPPYRYTPFTTDSTITQGGKP